MKNHPALDCIDHQFILAVDQIKAAYKENKNTKHISDHGIGGIIYPTNKTIVKNVRDREKHLPHLVMIAFAEHFNIEIGYFYDKNKTFTFSFEQHDPNNFLSNINENGIDTFITNKITFFLEELKEQGYTTCDQISEKLNEFKKTTIERLIGIPYEKALGALDSFFDLAFTEIRKNYKPTANKEIQPTDNHNTNAAMHHVKIDLLEDLLKATKATIAAKDSEIETLKRYNTTLEGLAKTVHNS
ncbi:hypothetical protein [Aquimarina latercula]|uniref:hypothetical protein n=1 Tax=Aquimarina latercula TaxID=987 RepID=UPI0004146015|nr:hypothetical protein [Aquimarina latercula]